MSDSRKADYSPEQYESVVDTGLRAIESLMDAVIAAGKERDRYKAGIATALAEIEEAARDPRRAPHWSNGLMHAAGILRRHVPENGSSTNEGGG